MSFLSSLIGGAASLFAGPVAGPLISGATSLLGGAMSRNSAAKEADKARAANDPANIRRQFEAAGLHPSLGFQGWQPSVAAPDFSVSHQLMAQGLAQIGDGLGEANLLRLKNTQQQQRNEALQRTLDRATLGANVGGIYSDKTIKPTRYFDPTGKPRHDAGVPPASSEPLFRSPVPLGDPLSDQPDRRGLLSVEPEPDPAPKAQPLQDQKKINNDPRDLVTVAPKGQPYSDRLPSTEIYDAGRTGRKFMGYDILPYPGLSDIELVQQRTGEGGEVQEFLSSTLRDITDYGFTIGHRHGEGKMRDYIRDLYQDRRISRSPVGDFNSYDPQNTFPLMPGVSR